MVSLSRTVSKLIFRLRLYLQPQGIAETKRFPPYPPSGGFMIKPIVPSSLPSPPQSATETKRSPPGGFMIDLSVPPGFPSVPQNAAETKWQPSSPPPGAFMGAFMQANGRDACVSFPSAGQNDQTNNRQGISPLQNHQNLRRNT